MCTQLRTNSAAVSGNVAALSSGAAPPSRHFSSYFNLLNSSPNSFHLRPLHARLITFGLAGDAANLLLFYSRRRHRLLPSALSLFLHGGPFAWNSVIADLARSGEPHLSLSLFLSMLRSPNPQPGDEFNSPVALRSSAALRSLSTSASIHTLSVKIGLSRNIYVASALVFCYSCLSQVSIARHLFDEIPRKDVILWTSMLSGYAQSKEPEEALGVLREMIGEGFQLDAVVMVSLLLVCGQLGHLRIGRSVHGCSVRRCFGLPLSLGNALVDMYVKCGDFRGAEMVFSRMPKRDVISWSALISGHGLNGHADAALKLFERMGDDGIRPNSVTFLGVLSACGHAGMVERAWFLFDMMKRCGVEPELKHYACMVDVLGRAGRLVEAERFVQEMPIEPDEAVLGALLSGCRVHGNVEVGERVSGRLLRMRPGKSGYYVILANMYSDAGRFDDAERVRGYMKHMNMGKLPGRSSIELEGVYAMIQDPS